MRRALVLVTLLMAGLVLQSCTRLPRNFEMTSSAPGHVDLVATGRPMTVLGVFAGPMVDDFPDQVAAAGMTELRRQLRGAWLGLEVMGPQVLDAGLDTAVSPGLRAAVGLRGYLTAEELTACQRGLIEPGFLAVARVEQIQSRGGFRSLAIVRESAHDPTSVGMGVIEQSPDSASATSAGTIHSAFPIMHHRISVDVRLQIYDPETGSLLWDGVATESIEQDFEASVAAIEADESLGEVAITGAPLTRDPARDEALLKAMSKGFETLVRNARARWSWYPANHAHSRQLRDF